MTGVQEFPVELPEDFDHDAKRARQKKEKKTRRHEEREVQRWERNAEGG